MFLCQSHYVTNCQYRTRKGSMKEKTIRWDVLVLFKIILCKFFYFRAALFNYSGVQYFQSSFFNNIFSNQSRCHVIRTLVNRHFCKLYSLPYFTSVMSPSLSGGVDGGSFFMWPMPIAFWRERSAKCHDLSWPPTRRRFVPSLYCSRVRAATVEATRGRQAASLHPCRLQQWKGDQLRKDQWLHL